MADPQNLQIPTKKDEKVQTLLEIICRYQMPLIIEKYYCIDAFVMGHHVYKDIWKPVLGEELDVSMEPNNIKDKYAVAVYQKGKSDVIGHLPLGRSAKFAKTIYFFLKASSYNSCKAVVNAEKAVNQKDDLGMKVPCCLEFIAEERYLNILKETLPKLL